MKGSRKKWTTPQLIVLGRGTPEENVLQSCKTSTINASGGTKKKCSRGGKCGTKCKLSAAT